MEEDLEGKHDKDEDEDDDCWAPRALRPTNENTIAGKIVRFVVQWDPREKIADLCWEKLAIFFFNNKIHIYSRG
jgi:hypothetical protein